MTFTVPENMTIPPERDADWREDAACATTDPDIWVLNKGDSSVPAKTICGGCGSRERCLQYALDNDARGIWGGTSDRERARIRRDR